MKKTLTVAALSSALVLGVAASALALHDTATEQTSPAVAAGASKVTIDGGVRERGMYDKDNSAENNASGRTMYDNRVQLGVKAQVSAEATGYIKLESGTDDNDVDKWGNAGTGFLHVGGKKLGSPSILEAWINYQPGAWGVKAGHMPLALGNKLFFDHTTAGDDALVFYANPNEATHIAALTIKFDEQVDQKNGTDIDNPATTNDNSDDLDGYVALITHKLNDNVNLGANWTYLRGSAENEQAGTLLGGLSMHNIGLTADGKVGAIEYLADAEFQFGDVRDDGDNTMDASGWAMKLGGKYDLGVGKVGLLFGYGSGKDAHDDNYGGFKEDQDQFINFLGDTNYDTIIAGYRATIPGNGGMPTVLGAASSNIKNSGLSNLTEYQINASTKTVCPLTGKDLSIMGSLTYLMLSEERDNGYVDSDGDEVYTDKVGTELDLVAAWTLTPGLTYTVQAAYLWTGDVFETANDGTGHNPDNLAFLRHSLELKF